MFTKPSLNASRLKPSVPKCWLFALSGLMWSIVGLGMCIAALGWLSEENLLRGVGKAVFGISGAALAYRLGFVKIARTNIRRLKGLPSWGCLFAFQAWRSYLVILFMVGLGIALRQSIVPKDMLACVYIAIGGALFLSSFLYYQYILRLIRASRHRANHTL